MHKKRWLIRGLNESTEKVNGEVFFFSGRSFLFLLGLFFFFGLLFLLLLLGWGRGGGRSSRCAKRYFGESFADQVVNFSSADGLEDGIDLSLIDWLSSGLEDSND